MCNFQFAVHIGQSDMFSHVGLVFICIHTCRSCLAAERNDFLCKTRRVLPPCGDSTLSKPYPIIYLLVLCCLFTSLSAGLPLPFLLLLSSALRCVACTFWTNSLVLSNCISSSFFWHSFQLPSLEYPTFKKTGDNVIYFEKID